MKKHFLFLAVFIALISARLVAQTYLPVATVGYSLDGVAENTTAIATTGGQLDASDFVLYSQFYGTIYGGGAVGLPNNGLIASGTRTYQLQNYMSYNVQRINPNAKDSLTFVTPQAFPSISLLSFAAQGSSIMTVTVRFTDNSTQVFNSIPLDDWFTASPSIINGFDRVQRTTGTPALVGGAGNPRMFGVDLAIACGNRGKPVKRIITQNNSPAYICIMAVAGMVPAYSASATPQICSGSTATLTGSGFVTYTWQPSGGFGGSSLATVTVSPASTTTYTLEGTDGGGCPGYTTVSVNVSNGLPVLSLAGSSQSVCLGSAATITVSGASNYTLSSSSANGATFAPVATASYVVSGANACGTSSVATTISVEPLPAVFPSASNSTLCSGSSLTLNATGTATGYVWSGGAIPINNGVGFVPSASIINYSVVGTSSLGCTALATIPVTVYATPVLPPTSSSTLICIGGSATLSAQGAINYTWTSATQTVFTPTMVVTPAGIGVTTYTVIKNNSTCSDTKIISITTNSLPTVFALASPPLVCALQPAVISIAGGQTYTWTAPGTPTYNFNGASVIVYPQTSSLYTVAASDGTCITVTTLSLSVDPNPTISITATSPSVCMGQSVTLTANGGNSYTWTTPSGTSSGPSIQVSPTSATAYTLTGDNSFSCTASANQVILAFPSPVLNITVTKPVVCTGGLSTLTASGANNYTWGPTANNVLTPAAVVISTASVTGPVVYDVTGTFSATGCPGTQTTMVTVYIPTFAITGNTNTCQGGIVTLSGSGANSYTWNTGSGTQLGQVLTATVTAPSVYTVSASATSSLVTCSSTQTIAVGINANPTVIAVPQRTTICKFEHVEIHAGGATSYTWQNPGSGSVNGATLTVSPQNLTNNYTVTGTDANGCVSTGSTQVKVSTCPGFGELSNGSVDMSIFPNPNHGEFTISASEDVSLILINSLGQTVRNISLSGLNNYQVSITELPTGVYFLSGQVNGSRISYKIIVSE